MYNINPEFLNDDGTINYETALRAGPRARAVEMRKGMEFIWKAVQNSSSFVVENLTMRAIKAR